MSEKRLLFACPVNYLDPSNGASIATREALHALAERGWEVHTFCGNDLDFVRDEDVWQLLSDRGAKPVQTVHNDRGERFSLINYRDGKLFSTLFIPETKREKNAPINVEVDKLYTLLLQKTMQTFKPQVVLTYGGSRLTLKMFKMEQAKVAVFIHNCAYSDSHYTDESDIVLVPSKFSRDFYKERLGCESVIVPTLFKHLPDLSSAEPGNRMFVTTVNPDGNKGILWFTKIVQLMDTYRPDIPFLAVEGRGSWLGLGAVLPVLKGVNNLYAMANTMNPQDFLDVTKVMLVPSHFNETFGRVPVEAMMNGIPVIGSDRGSLPEVISDAGVILHIPLRHTPVSDFLPTDKEVDPWIQAIVKLWDDQQHYDKVSRNCRKRSERWDYEHVAQQYDDIFSGLIRGNVSAPVLQKAG